MKAPGPTRRAKIRAAAVVVACAGVIALMLLLPGPRNADPAGGRGPRAEPSPKPAPAAPNILIFITDDQRPDSMDAMPMTSELFEKKGVWYPNAVVTTPLCCPSRASIFSGQFVHNHDVRFFNPYDLDQGSTLQAVLDANGYRTAFFGKYLNGWAIEDDPPHFDRWASFPQSTEETYVGGTWNVDGDVEHVFEYSTDFLRDRAFGFLDEGEADDDGRPWLMYISTPAAHFPNVAAPRFRNASVPRWESNEAVGETNLGDKPPHVRKPFNGKCNMRCGTDIRTAQYRSLESVDLLVDEVMTKLRELDQSKDTLVLYLSDNGLMWGEHGLTGKRFSYAPSIRVPFGMRWPGELEPGIDHRLVANIDVAPTVLDAVGIEPATGVEMDGRSLLSRDWERDEILLEHYYSRPVPGYASLWGKDYQYTEYYERDLSTVAYTEYYDLAEDPWQLRNLLSPNNISDAPDEETLEGYQIRLQELRACEGRACW